MTSVAQPEPDFLYEVARHQLDVQLDFVDAVDTKLGIIFATGSAELAVAAAFLAIRADVLVRAIAPFLVIGGIAYLVLAVGSLIGLRHRDWEVGPKVEHLARLYFDGLSEADVKRQATWWLLSAWDVNKPRLRAKSRCLVWAVAATAVETIAALLAAGQLAATGVPHP